MSFTPRVAGQHWGTGQGALSWTLACTRLSREGGTPGTDSGYVVLSFHKCTLSAHPCASSDASVNATESCC